MLNFVFGTRNGEKEIELSDDERELLVNYRKLTLKQKRFVRKLLRNTRNKTDIEKEQIFDETLEKLKNETARK